MQIKFLAFLLFGVFPVSLFAQAEKNKTSDHFVIEGEVSTAVKVDLDNLLTKFGALVTVDSLVIFSHDMKPKHTIHNLKGVLVRDILSTAKLRADNPKDLSSFYFVCEATDGYKVVFSWNELFNTETGNHAMVVVSEEDNANQQLEDRIALISPTDRATGRRYVKWLKQITVARIK